MTHNLPLMPDSGGLAVGDHNNLLVFALSTGENPLCQRQSGFGVGIVGTHLAGYQIVQWNFSGVIEKEQHTE